MKSIRSPCLVNSPPFAFVFAPCAEKLFVIQNRLIHRRQKIRYNCQYCLEIHREVECLVAKCSPASHHIPILRKQLDLGNSIPCKGCFSVQQSFSDSFTQVIPGKIASYGKIVSTSGCSKSGSKTGNTLFKGSGKTTSPTPKSTLNGVRVFLINPRRFALMPLYVLCSAMSCRFFISRRRNAAPPGV